MKRFALVLLLCASCAHPVKLSDMRFEMPGKTVSFQVEVARSVDQQRTGLMGRAQLPADRGMLFVWRDVSVRQFFMKNTLIPLDLVSIRAGRVVGIQHMVPCTAEPCPLTPTPPADAALELNAGVAARSGIVPGTLADSPALA